jgi:hypothetical protein
VNWQAFVFALAVGNQALAGIVFIALYVRESDWRSSPVGRHMLYWSVAAVVLDLTWELLVLVPGLWIVFVLLAAQAAFGLLAWQRVWLVWRAQRE